MDAGAFNNKQGNHDLAEEFFLKSIAYDKKNMAAYIKYAAMLFETKQPDKSFQVMKQAISIDTQVTDICLALMVLNHVNDDQFYLALPDRVKPYLILGDFFKSMGDSEKAKKAYLNGLGFVSNEKQVKKTFFLHIYNFFRHNHQYENALHIILDAISHFPDDSGFHRIAGDLYKKLGIDYRAEEEFRKADILKQTSK